jgi:hypothetical protein
MLNRYTTEVFSWLNGSSRGSIVRTMSSDRLEIRALPWLGEEASKEGAIGYLSMAIAPALPEAVANLTCPDCFALSSDHHQWAMALRTTIQFAVLTSRNLCHCIPTSSENQGY